MSDKSTIQLIDMYLEESSAPMFLSGFFQSPPANFHTTEDVEIDIQRDSEQVAIVIKDLSLPPNHNENNAYTNKRLRPPIYDEEGTITSFDMIQRQPGQNPFVNPSYLANAVKQSFSVFRKLENKIRRSIELQASQILQTGTLSLIDKNGTVVYTIDFSPKASHFTTPTAWAADGSTGAPLTNIGDLASIIRRDGKKEPFRLTFGATAFLRFLANAEVKNRLLQIRGELIQAAPVSRGQGATFQGWVWVGNYRFEMWTYDGFYAHPQTGTLTPFVADNKVILDSGGRLDLTYGAIPMIVAPDQRALPFLPPRISSAGGGLDLTTNAWVTNDGKRVMVSAGTRPLTIPTAIDTFGCITAF
jgi:Phage major capsid protein E